ncbi:MAG: dehydrogenase [Gammaproteobacteria bacterium RIFCSPHIGHO2_12_FULL_37_14]|nr:MAG: dehydrogenase [Gammaproteobacteria bacterium RIFCSPHIGHO2_12_FULL_37_14]
MKLKGRCAIVTGANQGLGFEIAKQFVSEGAHVMLCARNTDKLYAAQKELQNLSSQPSKVLAQTADVSKPEQVEALISYAISEFGQVDILVANAGVYGTKGLVEEVDWNEWSAAIDINLKGTVLQCRAVLPYFKKRRYGKIMIISGGGATKPMPYFSAYAASKAAIVRFAETLAEEVGLFGIDVNSVAPGALNTRLLDEVLAAGPEKVGQTYYDQALKQKQNGGTPLSTGASLCVFLASAASDGITGKLISAVWDPWESLSKFTDELKDSDIYTLRRIVPQDRGKTWNESQ